MCEICELICVCEKFCVCSLVRFVGVVFVSCECCKVSLSVVIIHIVDGVFWLALLLDVGIEFVEPC